MAQAELVKNLQKNPDFWPSESDLALKGKSHRHRQLYALFNHLTPKFISLLVPSAAYSQFPSVESYFLGQSPYFQEYH